MPKKSAATTCRRPRRPEPFFRTQTRSWYVQISGRQINLGRDRKAAWAKYHEIMATTRRAGTTAWHAPAAELLDEFLEHVSKNRAPSTYLWYVNYLRSFCNFVGRKIHVADLKPFHVTQWLDTSFADLSDSSRSCAVKAVKSAFNWAAGEGYLEQSPIRTVKRPKAGRREMVMRCPQVRNQSLS